MNMVLKTYSRRGKLTDSMISKAVLSPIASGFAPPSDLINHLGLATDMPKIINLFHQHGGISIPGEPKYLAFYRAIKSHFKENFEWRKLESSGSPRVIFEKPHINFARPTLLTLLTCSARGDLSTTPQLMTRYPALRRMPQDMMVEFESILKNQSFFLPDEEYIATVAELLIRGLQGEEITLVSPVCPDYGYERIRDSYRYTFDQLNDGVGLVAQRIIQVLPVLQDFFQRHGIQSRLVIAAGDFEGLDDATLTRVGETRASFQEKMERSQTAILNALGRPAESVFLVKMAGGEEAWNNHVHLAKAELEKENLPGHMSMKVDLNSILAARMPLYRAWHKDRTRTELEQVLLHQCAEYATMGLLFNTQWRNSMVIGGDHNRMMPFYWLHQRIPVLYLKRIY